MKIINREYTATYGFADDPLGLQTLHIAITETEDGFIIVRPTNQIHPYENEIQISGDKKVRELLLPKETNEHSILFLDNPLYDKKSLRRKTKATLGIPLGEDDPFVNRFIGLSTMTNQEILKGNSSGIEDIGLRNEMLPYIKEGSKAFKKSLVETADNTEWVERFVEWRDKLKTKLTYAGV